MLDDSQQHDKRIEECRAVIESVLDGSLQWTVYVKEMDDA